MKEKEQDRNPQVTNIEQETMQLTHSLCHGKSKKAASLNCQILDRILTKILVKHFPETLEN